MSFSSQIVAAAKTLFYSQEVIKEEMLNFMKEFHTNGGLTTRLNSTFITLIPKKNKAINLNEYRPISLVGAVYKLLSKVLATRLKRVLPTVIGDSQSSFLGGKSILDGILIANEVVDEALNILHQRARELRLLKRAVIGAIHVVISYLQFADGSLLFCEAKLSEVLYLKRILRCFEIASGLKINYHKSVLCGIGTSDSVLSDFASLLNCKAKKLPLNYLGLPLGASPQRKKTWKPVIDKFKIRLAG
ncbi:uncharacterized protein LOC114262269 [Camellia sinensis]|uniref:uncharacterized protein LOC114262269 n=1 Tax=Camellia sinensis TaxID=4442 RepID=UPI001036B51A|nr:uncharacterized protein LOC114262269 [Camellia sinensis]